MDKCPIILVFGLDWFCGSDEIEVFHFRWNSDERRASPSSRNTRTVSWEELVDVADGVLINLDVGACIDVDWLRGMGWRPGRNFMGWSSGAPRSAGPREVCEELGIPIISANLSGQIENLLKLGEMVQPRDAEVST